MTRSLHITAFVVGLAAVCWVGAGYVGTNPLALLVTLLIAAFYLAGGWELWRFDQATGSLTRAIANAIEPPTALGPWLDTLHPSLRNSVRLRVEGERVGLPGPALTPYLAGLLVLLGMLGTFLGMVVTLNGTGIALDSASDLTSIRASLAAPVRGLGLAFGTSVAGVAASAMLGLVSALCRRDRLQAAQGLDTRIATSLRPFSLAHRRDETFRLMQLQAESMPVLVDRLQAMMTTLERQGEALNARLLADQDRFHSQAELAYSTLASSVERTLSRSLVEAAQAAGATIQPAVEATMAGIASETAALHANAASLWKTSLAEHQRQADAAHAELKTRLVASDQQRLSAWTDALAAMTASLQQEWQLAGAQTARQQAQICETLAHTAEAMSAQSAAHAKGTIAEIARLVDTASDAPRAAAEVITELRSKLSDSVARDNTMLEERGRLVATLAGVLETVTHAATDQRAAIDTLVAASSEMLERSSTHFTTQLAAQTAGMGTVAAQLTGSAVEVASLGEAFGAAVQLFSQSNEKLGAQLQRIEAALGKSLTRSDEQLAYYVAQAREVIDLSMLSQKQIVDDMQRLAGQRALATSDT